MTSRQAWNFNEFAAIATRDEEDFADMGVVVSQGRAAGSTYTFKDNGCDVLGVAHLDTVQVAGWSSVLKVDKQPVLVCPRLDDRLGVYIITRLLPKLGVECDWLLTTGEEIGQSSAELFKSDKQYNWAFSFDRAGTDAVMYQFEHKALRKLVQKAGFRVGQGSFSDLSFLDIGCSGINFGCGYNDAHSVHAYAILRDTFMMVDKFKAFWKRYASQPLPYNPHTHSWQSWRGYGRNGYGSLRGSWQDYTNYPRWSDEGYNRGYPESQYDHYQQNWTEADYEALDESDKAYLDWYLSDKELRDQRLSEAADRWLEEEDDFNARF